MSGTIELRTARAVLRPWRLDEAEVLHDIRRRVDVARWLDNGLGAMSHDVEHARDQVRQARSRATAGGPLFLAIVPHDADAPVGAVLLSDLPGGPEVQVGWQLHPDATGHGWATEAARAMLAHGLAHHPRVWADMWPANLASAAVAERIGMVDLGEVLDPWYGIRVHPQGRIFVAHADGDTPEAVTDARAHVNALAARDPFPDEPPPRDDVVLPGWEQTAARLRHAAGLD